MNSILRRRRALMAKQEGETFPVQEIGVELAVISSYGKINANTGEFIATTSSTDKYSQFIPVNPSYVYKMTVFNNRDSAICWYDKNQVYIGGRPYRSSAGTPLSNITPESNWRWIRISGGTGNGGPLGLQRQA